MSADFFNSWLLSFSLCLPRLVVAMLIVPGFSSQLLGGAMVRNTVAAVFALPLLPGIMHQYPDLVPGIWLLSIILKEMFIGLLIGFVTAIPFQAVESTGFIIDNHRGASMATTLNPLSSEQTSPLGILLNQVASTLFFALGYITIWLHGVYQSYLLWPITEMLPQISPDAPYRLFQIFHHLLEIAWRLSAPAIITMFLAEFGLGLMNRFVPQMNVFILSMPIKSGIALFILLIYLTLLFHVFVEEMEPFIWFSEQLKWLIKV